MPPSKTFYRVNKEVPLSLNPDELLPTGELRNMRGSTVLYHEHQRDTRQNGKERPVRIEIAPRLFGTILSSDETASKHMHPLRIRLIRHTNFLVRVE